MPQTRYVLQCALRAGLHPIVVFNKCDREGGEFVSPPSLLLLMLLRCISERRSLHTQYEDVSSIP